MFDTILYLIKDSLHCPMSESLLLFKDKKINSIGIFYQCLKVDLHNISQKKDDIDRQK